MLNNKSSNRSMVPSTDDGGETTSSSAIIPRIQLKWPDVATALDRLLLILFIVIDTILVIYFLRIWLAYFVSRGNA